MNVPKGTELFASSYPVHLLAEGYSAPFPTALCPVPTSLRIFDVFLRTGRKGVRISVLSNEVVGVCNPTNASLHLSINSFLRTSLFLLPRFTPSHFLGTHSPREEGRSFSEGVINTHSTKMNHPFTEERQVGGWFILVECTVPYDLHIRCIPTDRKERLS